MRISATLRDGQSMQPIFMEVPILRHPLLPVPYVDSRWARPIVFHDITRYPLAETNDVQNDFRDLVKYVNDSSETTRIERFKEGLLKVVDAHISRCGRLLFCDLLMYVDCMAYLCYASNLMSETQINNSYASWVKYVVCNRKHAVMCSTKWGAVSYSGSDNEEDLDSCF